MSADSNKTLFRNSIILYIRLFCVSLFGFFTTRFALQSLGLVDFGLFALVGSVISFMSVINTMMISSSNRFIASALGKGDTTLVNRQFNVSLAVHAALALATALVAFPLGDWYILRFINYDGDVQNALMVYNITIAASIFSFMGVPFNGLLLAKEKFFVFCSTDVLSNAIKMIVAFLLIDHFQDKLMIYSWTMAITTAYPTLVFYLFCKSKYPQIIKFKIIKELKYYKEVFDFTVWVGYGTVVQVAKSQFASIFTNFFFGTVLNSALGISNSLKNIVESFSTNVTKPMEPQIVKSYSAGDTIRCESLMALSAKTAFLMVFLLSVPLLIETEFVIRLWLSEVPPHSVTLTRLYLFICIVDAFSSGITDYVFARGNIKMYQLSVNTLYLISIPVAFVVLKLGAPVYGLLATYLVFSILVFVCKMVVLSRCYQFDITFLFKMAYRPAVSVIISSIPVFVLCYFVEMRPIVSMAVSIGYVAVCEYIFGLSSSERKFIKSKIQFLRHE